MDFTILKTTRTDSTINFDWGSGSPVGGMDSDMFSVRWTGQVSPRFSETYTFYTTTDDGARLTINGQLIIDNWTGPTERSGTITLVAGQRYDLQMDYYDRRGRAMAQLSWSSSSQPRQIIPQSQLYPTTAALAFSSVSVSSIAAGVPTGSEILVDQRQGEEMNGGFPIEATIGAPTHIPVVTAVAGAQAIESDNPVVGRTSGWVAYSNPPGSSGGSYLVNTSPADTLTLFFSGTRLEILTVNGPAFGRFAVFIDDRPAQIVDSAAPSFVTGGRVVIDGLSDGIHTLGIRAEGSVVAIDAFIVNTAPPASNTPSPTEVTASWTPTPTNESATIITATVDVLPTLTPTAETLLAALPYADNFDTDAGWIANSAWTLNSDITRGGTAWFADNTQVGLISLLEQSMLIDLATASHPQLTFWQRSNLAANDIMAVDVSVDNGNSWTAFDQQVGLHTDWTMRTVDLTVYQGQVIRLRFRLQTMGGAIADAGTTGYWIDELIIQDVNPAIITEEPTKFPTDTTLQTATAEVSPTETGTAVSTPLPTATATAVSTPMPTATPISTPLPTETLVSTVVPDTDTDGFTDDVDQCPVEAGLGTVNGCPLPSDSDGDGISDETDQCPIEAVPGTTSGCLLPPIVAPTLEGGTVELPTIAETETP
jgi:hypothetical protein